VHPKTQIGVAVIDVAGLIMGDPNEQLDEEMAQMFGNAVAIGDDDDDDGDYVINAVDHASCKGGVTLSRQSLCWFPPSRCHLKTFISTWILNHNLNLKKLSISTYNSSQSTHIYINFII